MLPGLDCTNSEIFSVFLQLCKTVRNSIILYLWLEITQDFRNMKENCFKINSDITAYNVDKNISHHITIWVLSFQPK
jgi:hypothetical protein